MICQDLTKLCTEAFQAPTWFERLLLNKHRSNELEPIWYGIWLVKELDQSHGFSVPRLLWTFSTLKALKQWIRNLVTFPELYLETIWYGIWLVKEVDVPMATAFWHAWLLNFVSPCF